MTENNKDRLAEIAGNDEMLKKIVRKVKKMSMDPKYVSLYDEEKLDKLARKVAEEDAREKGYESGKNDGYESGKKEQQIEIAKKMLEEKIDIDLISKITGMTKKEIEELK